MLDATHQFFLCVRDNEGRELFRKEAEPLQTVYEDLLYSAVLAGEVPNDGTSPPVTIEPEFRDSRLHAVHAALGLRTKRYTLDLFRDQASQILASPELVERANGATLSWDVEAKAIDANAGSKPRREFFRAGEVATQHLSAALRTMLESRLIALGLVRRTPTGYRLQPDPSGSELVRRVLERVGEKRVVLEVLYQELRKSAFGLTRPSFELVVQALMYSG